MGFDPHLSVTYALVQFHPNSVIPLLPAFIPALSATLSQVEIPGNLGKGPREEHESILCTTSPGMCRGPLRFACSHIKPFQYVLRH